MVVPLSLEGAFAPQTETLFFSQCKTDQELYQAIKPYIESIITNDFRKT
jgi:hypothetical protein